MHLSHNDNWEVIDQKEVPLVHAYYDDSQVQITSISAGEITQSFSFDASSQAPSSPLQRHKLLKAPSSPFSKSFRLSRSPSPSSAYEDEESFESDAALFRDPRDFSPSQARDALISARNQLLSSSEMRKMGVNVLFSEGWSITKLRRNGKYRLQVRYTARPAKAVLRSGAAKASLTGLPPFMDILEGSW